MAYFILRHMVPSHGRLLGTSLSLGEKLIQHLLPCTAASLPVPAAAAEALTVGYWKEGVFCNIPFSSGRFK